jgi:SAM-dependent methyltransferase
VTSHSARVSSERPFYNLHARAYDALITDPVEPWVQAVHDRLESAGLEGASILDAGCGTGRHAQGLVDRGHRVTLLDASQRLLAIARRRCPGSPAHHADICSPGITGQFDAITCRGVLNDLVHDDERDAALETFRARCRPDGLLFLDLREARASQQRADGQARHLEVTLDDGASLLFTSRPSWSSGRILIEERYQITLREGTTEVHEYTFTMRPWKRHEIEARLDGAGFTDIQTRPGVARRTGDRLFVTARRTH